MSDEGPNQKNDLTGLLDLPPLESSSPESTPGFETEAESAPAVESDPFALPTEPEGHPFVPAESEAAPLAELGSLDATELDPPSTFPAPTPLESVREYAEQAPIGSPPVEVAHPFTLLIEGKLNLTEREKLTEILSRENIGLSELELEPQFDAGRILIPRISEYLGVILIQLLRSSQASLRFGPSREIFASPDAEDEKDRLPGDRPATFESVYDPGSTLPGDRIPVTPDSSLPGLGAYRVLDALTATAQLRTQEVEAEGSVEYAQALEALKREIRQKAFHRGADAVLKFSVSLTPLSDRTRYRVTAVGSAVRSIES